MPSYWISTAYHLIPIADPSCPLHRPALESRNPTKDSKNSPRDKRSAGIREPTLPSEAESRRDPNLSSHRTAPHRAHRENPRRGCDPSPSERRVNRRRRRRWQVRFGPRGVPEERRDGIGPLWGRHAAVLGVVASRLS
ncbi:hypothetical protein BHM03_00036571 [Ensete ventricosum]|nr:hypothetical protein BHM03_00036571 [Ensete ventricosum]